MIDPVVGPAGLAVAAGAGAALGVAVGVVGGAVVGVAAGAVVEVVVGAAVDVVVGAVVGVVVGGAVVGVVVVGAVVGVVVVGAVVGVVAGAVVGVVAGAVVVGVVGVVVGAVVVGAAAPPVPDGDAELDVGFERQLVHVDDAGAGALRRNERDPVHAVEVWNAVDARVRWLPAGSGQAGERNADLAPAREIDGEPRFPALVPGVVDLHQERVSGVLAINPQCQARARRPALRWREIALETGRAAGLHAVGDLQRARRAFGVKRRAGVADGRAAGGERFPARGAAGLEAVDHRAARLSRGSPL